MPWLRSPGSLKTQDGVDSRPFRSIMVRSSVCEVPVVSHAAETISAERQDRRLYDYVRSRMRDGDDHRRSTKNPDRLPERSPGARHSCIMV